MSLSYDALRANVDPTDDSGLSRVEVNQRALIDKILARYASANAVYRELLQNSNDATADTAEIEFTTKKRSDGTDTGIVEQVVYRNNGIPFRNEDWKRLQKIAEGNPDVSKVGAFGVGAYTMFSICEEPIITSGDQVLAFVWRGDALYTKTVKAQGDRSAEDKKWTSFVLPSRDPYPLPHMVEFGEFLCASLTFTQCLKYIRVSVNGKERMSILKTAVQEPRPVQTPESASSSQSPLQRLWNATTGSNDGVVTATPNGTFYLQNSKNSSCIMESVSRITVTLDDDLATLDARYVSAVAKTKIPSDMARRMERVTKKQPPKQVNIQIFLNAQSAKGGSVGHKYKNNKAELITQSFSPRAGAGRIFIGFRTSQTTGLAAHLAAPFVPTVEREAMDLQDPTLRLFNKELLEMSGILMRLALEDTMYSVIDVAYKSKAAEREKLEKELQEQARMKKKAKEQEVAKASEEASEETTKEQEEEETSSSRFMGFARFMAKGVKKKIVSVVNTVEELIDDGSEYLNPVDPLPLTEEEEQAVVLMQSFCPQQSTPDPLVGTCIAQGFAHCLPTTAPPVLTRSGVVRGDLARLPNHGIESFVRDNVVRSVVYKNAEEYHTVIAPCKGLTMDDMMHWILSNTLEEERFIFLTKWWTKYARVDQRGAHLYSLPLKEAIRFHLDSQGSGHGESSIVSLNDILFYVDKGSLLSKKDLPMPESVLQSSLQEKIGDSIISDPALARWFSTLPIEIWAEFISHHASMVEGLAQDHLTRLEVLSALSKEFSRRSHAERMTFGGFLASIFADRRCIPFNTNDFEKPVADKPSDLYLSSAELKAFDGVGSFRKVSDALKSAGITDDFLLALGVRKSVSVDFLFASLDTLKWSSDPKPLVEYLRSATLTKEDFAKLSQTRYLPADGDDTGSYAPSELFLPNLELRIFPHLKVLKWPSESEISERSENGKFLVNLGMNTMPPLSSVLKFTTESVVDEKTRLKCLDFLADRLGPHGIYRVEYSRMRYSDKKRVRILPCTVKIPLASGPDVQELHSPVTCFSDEGCGVMGFPVLDPTLGDKRKLYGNLFQCEWEPEPEMLLRQLMSIVGKAKASLRSAKVDQVETLSDEVEKCFALVFKYLSHRSSDFSYSSLSSLKRESFIPCRGEDKRVEWFRADQVFFRGSKGEEDSITEELFNVVEFSPFLATAGVKQEATTRDLFLLLLSSPKDVLDSLGSEAKYRSLLRRIASNPPFSRVTAEIKNAPFLLAYKLKKTDDEKSSQPHTYELTTASDIFIIDNSFFGRMFDVKRAPHESDLEEFYAMLGSSYISKSVERRFEVVGRPSDNTSLTNALKQRILERSPLLASPSITSRPLVSNASSLLSEKKFRVYETSRLMAVYSLNGIVRRNPTTCFSRPERGSNAIYVVSDFDWFDVGYAIGDLILVRCQLEDAFFISSLLEAPVEQLRARGFPIDRIIKPEPPPPPPEREPPEPSAASVSAASSSSKAPSAAQPKDPTDAQSNEPPGGSNGQNNNQPDAGFEQILHQMYPDASKDYIRDRLGKDPKLDDVRKLEEELSSGNYPRGEDASESATEATAPSLADFPGQEPHTPKKKGGLRKKLGRAFNGIRPGGFGGSPGSKGGENGTIPAIASNESTSDSMPSTSGGGIAGPATPGKPISTQEREKPVPAVSDAQSHDRLEKMLENSVNTSAAVNSRGIHSHDQTLTSIPEGLDRGDTCEVVAGHSLAPFDGPHGVKTQNGIRVFSTSGMTSSVEFLRQNQNVVESFSLTLARLCSVYNLSMSSIAIFHDPTGGTIAFNANKALHFNVRFFHALHFSQNKHSSAECYSYWYVTFAHELAHHMVSAHNKEHGFYTESYVTLYLPKLIGLLSNS